MQLNHKRVPMSIRGSYLSLRESERRLIIAMSDRRPHKESLFEIDLDNTVPIIVQPGCFDFGDFSVAMHGAAGMVIRGTNPILLKLIKPNGYNASYGVGNGGEVRICDSGADCFSYLRAVKGCFELDAPWQGGKVFSEQICVLIAPDNNGQFEITLSVSDCLDEVGQAQLLPSFEQCAANARNSFNAWCDGLCVGGDLQREAAYVLWCNTVSPRGNFFSDIILCSKAGMDAVWSWDHAFHALALAKNMPQFAFDNFILPFHFMDERGALPDTIAPSCIKRSFVKPPVHGLLYMWYMELNEYFCREEHLRVVFDALRKNTEWWLGGRRDAPCYWHGNDSGADNATCFDLYPVIQSPSLYAFLSVQCDALADIAARLGDNEAAQDYQNKAAGLADEIERRFFDGERLFVRPLNDWQPFYSQSLSVYLTVVAGKRLNRALMDKLADIVDKQFTGAYGAASEALNRLY